MRTNRFKHLILDALDGKTEDLRATPRARLDWAGPGAVLDLYRKSSGDERQRMVSAIGEILQQRLAPDSRLAELVQIAASLDLAEIEPQVRGLQSQSVAIEKSLARAIANYLAYRQLNASETRPERSHVRKARLNGRPNVRKRTA